MTLTGYRWWYAGQQPETGWRLRSVTKAVWWDGPHLTAPIVPRMEWSPECPSLPARRPGGYKPVLMKQCRCGIHAFRTERQNWEHLSRDIPDSQLYPVAGVVKLWGKVVEHEHGFRAEHALIERLWVPQRIKIKERDWGALLPGDICGLGLVRSWSLRDDEQRERKEPSYRVPEPAMLPVLSRVYGVDVQLVDRDCTEAINN